MAESTDTDLFPSALCNCTQKPEIHVHCYCNKCNGKAVNRRTQLNHIQLQEDIKKICTAENDDVMTGDMEISIEGNYNRLFFKKITRGPSSK